MNIGSDKKLLLFAILIIALISIFVSCFLDHEPKGLSNNTEFALKGNNNLFVSADFSDQNKLVSHQTSIQAWEIFTIENARDGKVYINSFKNLYVKSTGRDQIPLVANDSIKNDSCLFTLENIGTNKFRIKDFKERYLGLDSGKYLITRENTLSQTNIFSVEIISQKYVAGLEYYQYITLIIFILLLVISWIYFKILEKERIAILLLIIAAFSGRLFILFITNHLQLWDEQFHALVAKNMMTNPFSPYLYKAPVLSYDINNWTINYIWLHKPPLFLWQMAICMKVFGTTLFATRLPSIVMSSLLVFFVYRIAKLNLNSQIGFYAGILIACSNFIMELCSGIYTTDHNDICFLFYISASIWSVAEYLKAEGSRKKYFLILTGIFAGAAILVKWLVGLLIFFGWGISVLTDTNKASKWEKLKDIFIALTISMCVALPWQLYTHIKFPKESQFELNYSASHFSKVLEGHGGDNWFYLDINPTLYGVSSAIIIFALIIMVATFKSNSFRKIFYLSILAIYVFYTLAQTKMIAFTFCISLLIFLALGALIYLIDENIITNNSNLIGKKWLKLVMSFSLLFWICYQSINYPEVYERHFKWKDDNSSFYSTRERNQFVLKNLQFYKFDLSNTIVLNCRPLDEIPCMFFNNLVAAYSYIPDEKSYNILKKQHQIIVLNNNKLPVFVHNDTNVVVINAKYWD